MDDLGLDLVVNRLVNSGKRYTAFRERDRRLRDSQLSFGIACEQHIVIERLDFLIRLLAESLDDFALRGLWIGFPRPCDRCHRHHHDDGNEDGQYPAE